MTFKLTPERLELGKVRISQGDKVNLVVTAEAEVSFGQIVRLAFLEEKGRIFYARVTNAGSRSTLDEIEVLRDLKTPCGRLAPTLSIDMGKPCYSWS